MAGTPAVARRPPRLAHPHVRRPFLFARSQRRVRAQLRMIPPGPVVGTRGDPPRNRRGAPATQMSHRHKKGVWERASPIIRDETNL